MRFNVQMEKHIKSCKCGEKVLDIEEYIDYWTQNGPWSYQSFLEVCKNINNSLGIKETCCKSLERFVDIDHYMDKCIDMFTKCEKQKLLKVLRDRDSEEFCLINRITLLPEKMIQMLY